MNDLEYGPLLKEYEDGTKIYENGVWKDEIFFKVEFLHLRYKSEYDPNTGTWGKLEKEDFTAEIPFGDSKIEFTPDSNGNLVYSGGEAGVSRGPLKAALTYDEKGEIQGLILSAEAKNALGGIEIGVVARDSGTSFLSTYDTITVLPDGNITTTEHYTSNDPEYPYVKIIVTTYNSEGKVIEEQVNNIGDSETAAEMAATLSPKASGIDCFPAGTPITLADGSTKPIEHIRHGDIVLSHDKSGNLTPQIVDKLFTNTTDAFIRLSFTDRDDLIATPGHHFLTETGDYMEIGHPALLNTGRILEAARC